MSRNIRYKNVLVTIEETLHGINTRIHTAEEWINELEDRLDKFSQKKEGKHKENIKVITQGEKRLKC